MKRVGTAPLFAGVKSIYFDLDDTLCAYWNAAKKGLRLAFEDHPEHGHAVDDMILYWGEVFREFAPTIKDSHWYPKYLESGETTRVELMRRVLERAGVFDDALASDLSHTYYVERHGALELFPEAREVLEALHGRFTLGLITNGPADIQRQEIETLHIRQYFDHILIEGEMGKGKPHPDVMQLAESLMGHSGPEILFVGNSYRHDVAPARHAGWRQAWVRRPTDIPPTSQRTEPEGLPEGEEPPDITIRSLRELLPALGL
ncbi:MAG TPA: HAD family hydrolase [Fimbriimonadaceae bacterium]|nr:HAD family hydrolase [Fimbriimonadaceae bacterium]